VSETPVGRPKSAQLDAAIIDAALAEVAEHGYEGLSIERVARRAGTAKTSVYRRWKDKSALVAAVARSLVPSEDERAEAAATDHGSLRADLLSQLRLSTALFTPDRVRLAIGGLGRLGAEPELHRIVTEEVLGSTTRDFARVLQRGRDRGEVTVDVDAERIDRLCRGWFLERMLLSQGMEDPHETAAFVDEVLLPLLTR
jgi:AcrR family transcriptional regulator